MRSRAAPPLLLLALAVCAGAPGCAPHDDFVVPPRPAPLAPPPSPPAEDPRARELLDALHERFLARPFYAVASLHVERRGIERHVLLRLHHRGPGHALVRAELPPRAPRERNRPRPAFVREDGMTALRLGGRVHVWFPHAGVRIDLPPSLGGDRLLGSDVTYDDLLAIGGVADGLVATYVGEETRAGEPCHHLRLVPSTPAASLLDAIDLWIAVADGMPLAQESSTRRAGVVRSLEMQRGANSHLPLPTRWTAKSGAAGDSRTTLAFRVFEADPQVDPALFTLEGLTLWR